MYWKTFEDEMPEPQTLILVHFKGNRTRLAIYQSNKDIVLIGRYTARYEKTHPSYPTNWHPLPIFKKEQKQNLIIKTFRLILALLKQSH